jgi:hypothetical protein
MLVAATRWADVIEWVNQVRERLQVGRVLPPESGRTFAVLPPNGAGVSVETALNSRCTSDQDGDQRLFHWGLFDIDRRLPDSDIERIRRLAVFPRFTRESVEVAGAGKRLIFDIGEPSGEQGLRWAMVESGMQQQSVCLVCASLGAGMVFDSMGIDGRAMPGNRRSVMAFDIDAMIPSYPEGFWTEATPGGFRPWRTGNLPDPKRRGAVPLLKALTEARTTGAGSHAAGDVEFGQLIWAARGRTPHLYKSKAWGMTIPTWAGLQDLSYVLAVHDRTVYRYVNWSDGRPTHTLEPAPGVQSPPEAMEGLGDARRLIVLCVRESSGRAWWEIGYQLLNILIQATALELRYSARLLSDRERDRFSETGVPHAVAAVAVW